MCDEFFQAAALSPGDLSEVHEHKYRQAVLHGATTQDPASAVAPVLPHRRTALLPPLVAVQAVNQGRVSMESPLNAERFSEAQQYLKLYGSAHNLAMFYLRHGFMRLAVEYIVDEKVPPAVFIDTVFVHTLSHGNMDEMKGVLKAIDPQLERVGSYLLAACRHVTKNKLFSILYDLQVFMDDFYRAGITTIKFACKEGLSSEERADFLQKALSHFARGSAAAAEASDASKYSTLDTITSLPLLKMALKFAG